MTQTSRFKKGVYLRKIDRERLWHRANPAARVVINQDEVPDWMARVHCRREGGEIDPRPKCLCGHYNHAKYVNEVCPECHSKCLYQSRVPFEVTTFMGKLDGTRGFFNPHVFYQLVNVFGPESSNRFKILNYLINTAIPEPKKQTLSDSAWAKFQVYKKLNIPRGYNYFCDNFVEIISKLANPRAYIDEKISASHLPFKDKDKQRRDEVIAYAKMVEPYILSDHEPLLNSICFVLEKDGNRARYKTYKSSELQQAAVNIIMGYTSTKGGNDDVPSNVSRVHQNAMGRYLMKCNELMGEVFSEVLGGKHGINRKDCIGVRADFTARAVISLDGIDNGINTNAFRIPWVIGVELYRPELHNYLTNEYGWSKVKVARFLSYHERIYHPLIDELINKRLLREVNSGRGDPTLLNRNPILYQFSNQYKCIVAIKTDPNDLTFSIPFTCCAAYNGDFDGDEMQLVRMIDKVLGNIMEGLSMQKGLLDRSHGRKFGNLLGLPKPVLQLLHAYTNVYE